MDQKTSQYLVWPPFASGSATTPLHRVAGSCWILVGTGTHCHTRQSRASQTCSIDDMSGEYACSPLKNWDIFSFNELCTDPCDMGPCIIILKHKVKSMDDWHNNEPQDVVTVSRCIQIAIDKIQFCLLLPIQEPHCHHGTLFTTLTSANRSPTWYHTHRHIKHGTNALQVVFIFLFSIHINIFLYTGKMRYLEREEVQ